MAGAGAKKDPATEAVAVVPGGDVKEAVAASDALQLPAKNPTNSSSSPRNDELKNHSLKILISFQLAKFSKDFCRK